MRSLDAGTIGGAVEACRRRLIGATSTPWLDARMLAGHVTGLDASAIVAYGEHRLDARRRQQLFSLTERRATGEPIAYLVGFKEFCGLRLRVDRRVLVPRPETEELVRAVVADWQDGPVEILELGTGSGAIACALAHQLTQASITATDVSTGALEVAAANVAELNFGDRINMLESDLFAALPREQTYDVIVANLPYVAQDDSDLAAEVRAHEPAGALFAGADGLAIYQRMLADAPVRLRRDGRIYCECGPSTAAGLLALAGAAFPDRTSTVVLDDGGRERMVIVA